MSNVVFNPAPIIKLQIDGLGKSVAAAVIAEMDSFAGVFADEMSKTLATIDIPEIVRAEIKRQVPLILREAIEESAKLGTWEIRQALSKKFEAAARELFNLDTGDQ